MPTTGDLSAPLSLLDVNDDFQGDGGEISLADYYSADINTSIPETWDLPASGEISLRDLYARPRPVVPDISGVLWDLGPTINNSWIPNPTWDTTGANGDFAVIQTDPNEIPDFDDPRWVTSADLLPPSPAGTLKWYRGKRQNGNFWVRSGAWFRTAPSSTGSQHTVTQALYDTTTNYYGKFASGSVSPTSVFGYEIRYVFRSLTDSNAANPELSAFWVYLNSSSTAIPPSNIFDYVVIQASGKYITLRQTDATSVSTGTVPTGYRYWTFANIDFPSSQDVLDFATLWDGSGDVTIEFIT